MSFYPGQSSKMTQKGAWLTSIVTSCTMSFPSVVVHKGQLTSVLGAQRLPS